MKEKKLHVWASETGFGTVKPSVLTFCY